MAVTAGMVKELRERTSAGMLDCKKALVETDGDMEKAIEVLREKGLSKAAKKAGRIAAEGIVAVNASEDNKRAAIVEVNSETDFVAKNEKFRNYVDLVAKQAVNTESTDIETFLSEPWMDDTTKTVKDSLTEQIAVIGENMNIRRFARIANADTFVESYIHQGGKIGVLVEVATDSLTEEVSECAKNVAMQIAAMSPEYLTREEVSADYIEKETEIIKAQAINENPDKPESIIEKMVIGRINKQLKEVCLLDQPYVKDGDLTVAKYIDSVAKASGKSVKVVSFVRFETGEGIEKKEENFADEVAKQMNL